VPRLEEVVVLALAATRLARAISVDEITAPARERVEAWAQRSPASGWRNRTVELVGCPVCVGWWISVGVSLAAPGRQRLLRGAAVAGLQVLLALAERLISEEGRAAIHLADQAAERSPRPAA
jgi:hypothetical protein